MIREKQPKKLPESQKYLSGEIQITHREIF